MSKLIETANDEYLIIQQFYKLIEMVEVPDRNYLPRFTNEIKEDLKTILKLHYDNNSLKRKYYQLKDKENWEKERRSLK